MNVLKFCESYLIKFEVASFFNQITIITKMKKTTLYILLIFSSFYVFAQKSFKSTVVDSLTDTPIPYVLIKIKNTHLGTYTDSLGRFQLRDLKNADSIVLHAIGYQQKEVSCNLKSNVILLSPKNIQLDEVVIKQYSNKGKWKKVFDRKKVALFNNVILYEGTTVRRKVFNIKEKINGLRFFLLKPTEEISITLRPTVQDINGNNLLNRDYTATYHLKKGVSKKLTFDFKEDVKIPEEGAYLGIEVINAPNNQNYEKFVQLECTSDKISTSEVVTVVNYAQEDG